MIVAFDGPYPKADIVEHDRDVRFVPIADIGARHGRAHHARIDFGMRRRRRKCTGT